MASKYKIHKRRPNYYTIVVVALIILSLFYGVLINVTQKLSHSRLEIDGITIEPRQLSNSSMSANFSTNETVERSLFPDDIFTLEQRRNGAVILHALGIVYMFAALAIVCDEFFVPSLEEFVDKLKIPNDVAGATLMAAGGSAPEFFASLFGIFLAQNSIGFGTIVGSAVFNILFVIGVCGLVAKQALKLTWWPFFRDASFYIVGLALLIVFFRGGSIEWYESLVLFLLYWLYALFMFINGRAEKLANKLVSKMKKCCSCKKSTRIEPVPAPSPEPNTEVFTQEAEIGTANQRTVANLSISSTLADRPGYKRHRSSDSGFQSPSECSGSSGVSHNHNPPSERKGSSVPAVPPSAPTNQQKSNSSSRANSIVSSTHADIPVIYVEPIDKLSDEEADQEEGKEDEGQTESEPERLVHIKPPKSWHKRIQYVLFFPIIVLLFFTLPDVTKPRWKWFFPYVFLGSILWIGVFSYLLIWWATVIGDTAMIPPSILGATILAAGTSIPDLITSVIVARKGRGDMAVSSSIGSNMFDITVGLPLPWLLYSAVNNGQSIQVFSSGLFCSVILLAGMLLLTVGLIIVFRWTLGKLLGTVFTASYFVFVALQVLLETVIHCTIS